MDRTPSTCSPDGPTRRGQRGPTGPQRYPGRHTAPDACDARARCFSPNRTKIDARAMSARDARPPHVASGVGRVRRIYERGGSTRGSQNDVGGRQFESSVRLQTVNLPLPADPSDAHDGTPARTRPYPRPLPTKEAPRGGSGLGPTGLCASTLSNSRLVLEKRRCSAQLQAPVPPPGVDAVVIGVCGRLAVGQHRTSTQLG